MQENIAVVSLKRIQANAKAVWRIVSPERKLFAVVKANAYGHGIAAVAESLEEIADGFAVTDVAEGVFLRMSGRQKPILVFTPPTDEEDVFLAAMHDLTVTVCNFSSFRLMRRVAEKYSVPVRAHIKVNTGMNRLGLGGAPFKALCREMSGQNFVRIEGIYSHLYAPESQAAILQRKAFVRERAVAEEYFGRLTAHLAATGGILRGEEFFFDGVRAGICLYGYVPNGFQNTTFLPAMKVYTRCIQSRRFCGGGIGYGKAERAYGDLAVYRLGYADGLPRNDRAFGAIGNLCMDSCIREERVAFGKKKLVFSDAAKVARENNTIPYEVLCAATRRAKFEYRSER
jgi:alanine racemase